MVELGVGVAGDSLEIEIWETQGEFLFQHIPCAFLGSHFPSSSIRWVSINMVNGLARGIQGEEVHSGQGESQATQITLKMQKALLKLVLAMGKR